MVPLDTVICSLSHKYESRTSGQWESSIRWLYILLPLFYCQKHESALRALCRFRTDLLYPVPLRSECRATNAVESPLASSASPIQIRRLQRSGTSNLPLHSQATYEHRAWLPTTLETVSQQGLFTASQAPLCPTKQAPGSWRRLTNWFS